ncbi:unnamed protein product [Ixodes hexagonus]
MVEYAKKHFAHPKVCYEVLDISGNDVSCFVERYGQFDRIYSFFCPNWAKDPEHAFKNIPELLKPGGGCLLLFAASSIFIQLKKKLATTDHWQKYRKRMENFIPPSASLVDRDDHLSYTSGVLKSANLIPTTCELLQETCSYSSLEELTGRLMDLTFLSTLVTEAEKPLLLKDVTVHAANLWAKKEACAALFGVTNFLVRAHKPRP